MTEEQKTPKSEVSEELRLLGQRLREAFVAVRESEQTQEFRQELSRGLKELRLEIEEVVESEEVQRLQQSARAAVEDVSKGDVGQQIRRGVLSALKELNTRIESVIEEAEQGEPAEEIAPKETAK